MPSKRTGLVLLAAAAALMLCACDRASNQQKPGSGAPAIIELTSTAFPAGQEIPAKHTCDGENISPALHWSGVPSTARSLALICDDPDAPGGTWVHWVAYGIGPSETGLPEGIATTAAVLPDMRQGSNDFKRIGYGGPCPPPGKPHRYSFVLYALDAVSSLSPGATKQQLVRAMTGHILAQGELEGIYRRRE